MSKVIRISEETFNRLQEHAEPLVDTPAAVIERLLDFYERHNRRFDVDAMRDRRFAAPSIVSESSFLASPPSMPTTPSLFLVTATEESAEKTVLGSVPLGKIEPALSPREAIKLDRALNGRSTFHCWGMTADNRRVFDEMRPGDFVLISVSETGAFSYLARVLTKFESMKLAHMLWSDEEGGMRELIYVIDDVQRVSVDKLKLAKVLGYSSGKGLPGVVRVDPVRLEPQVLRFGSVEGLLWDL
ncbi:MAG TPA: hypothetical protein VMO47_13400 [Rhodothermales bacterium]|nr:hypothetical protein [Rhodothermales bacterium]